MPSDASWIPLREAWDRALYDADGFYRRSVPSEHFRTSVHASPLFAESLLTLARGLGVTSVVDVGAGAGELVSQLHALDSGLDLVAVEMRPRPLGLPRQIEWVEGLPQMVDGLVVANEVLDNVACDVVELDADGIVRTVEVERTTGEERLGPPATTQMKAWLADWWTLRQPGERAEVGLARESWWADVCRRVRTGGCLAVDYGHLLHDRPPLGSLTSYRAGRSVPVGFDGDRDVTADVAVDALCASLGGTLRRQSDWLAELGVASRRPAIERASTDPAGYLRALSRAGEAAELMSSPGLGDFWWLLSLPATVLTS